MSNTKNFLIALGMLATSAPAFAQTESTAESAPAAKKEKCYGIVKAGKNDCAAADGSHSCAGLSKNDGDGKEWVLLPSGTCDRVLGGLNMPKT